MVGGAQKCSQVFACGQKCSQVVGGGRWCSQVVGYVPSPCNRSRAKLQARISSTQPYNNFLSSPHLPPINRRYGARVHDDLSR